MEEKSYSEFSKKFLVEMMWITSKFRNLNIRKYLISLASSVFRWELTLAEVKYYTLVYWLVDAVIGEYCRLSGLNNRN